LGGELTAELLSDPESIPEGETGECDIKFTFRNAATMDGIDLSVSKGLLGCARIAQCSEEEISDRRVPMAVGVAARLTPLNELKALHALESILTQLLGAYKTTYEEDEAIELENVAETGEPTRRCKAVTVRMAEKMLLKKSLVTVGQMRHAELSKQSDAMISRVKDKKPGQGAATWASYLTSKQNDMNSVSEYVAGLSQKLDGQVAPAAMLQAVNLVYVWLVDAVKHPLCASSCSYPDSWPKSLRKPPAPTGEVALKSFPAALDAEALTRSEGIEYLQIFNQRCSSWGAWLLSQWAIAEGFSLTDLNAISSESVAIRAQFGASVPTEPALEALKQYGPLLEVAVEGAPTTWSGLLKTKGVSLTRASAVEASESGKCLMLSWPDSSGEGEMGKAAVEAHTGQHLVTLGEWHDRTYGAYSAGLTVHGQSFSKACQDLVEEKYELIQEVRLPNWALFVDVLRVWKRK